MWKLIIVNNVLQSKNINPLIFQNYDFLGPKVFHYHILKLDDISFSHRMNEPL